MLLFDVYKLVRQRLRDSVFADAAHQKFTFSKTCLGVSLMIFCVDSKSG